MIMVMFMVMFVIMVMVMFVMVIVVMVIVQMPIQVLHVMVMAVMLLIEDHIKIAAVDAGFLHSADLDLKPLSRNLIKHLKQFILICAQIQKGCHSHISADSRTAFQVQDLISLHYSFLPSHARRLICVAI